MLAITIKQPWATLIAQGHKWIENRTWKTNHRGDLAIHAAKDKSQMTDHQRSRPAEYPTGCIVAVSRLVECVRLEDLEQQEPETIERVRLIMPNTYERIIRHAHCDGPWLWILQDVVAIRPKKATGAQGLWHWGEIELPPEKQTMMW